MKNPKELFVGCPVHDKVTIKIKGYRRFVADETKARWICLKVAKGEISYKDVTIIDKNHCEYSLTEHGSVKGDIISNIFDCHTKIWLQVLEEYKKKLEEKK